MIVDNYRKQYETQDTTVKTLENMLVTDILNAV